MRTFLQQCLQHDGGTQAAQVGQAACGLLQLLATAQVGQLVCVQPQGLILNICSLLLSLRNGPLNIQVISRAFPKRLPAFLSTTVRCIKQAAYMV